jgi:hypothetical protein
MKTILFDESASETNNNFHPGINVTVRRGTKYMKSLEIGERIKLENLQGQTLGSGTVIQMVGGKILDIPDAFLNYEHDPKCRDKSGLVEVLQNCYDDPNIDMNEVTTAIAFQMDES